MHPNQVPKAPGLHVYSSKTSVKCYNFLTIALRIRWCSVCAFLGLSSWDKSPSKLWSLWLGTSALRRKTCSDFSVPKVQYYFSSEAFQFTLREPSETPITNLAGPSFQAQLCASRGFVISLHSALKSGEQIVRCPSMVSPSMHIAIQASSSLCGNK